MTPEQLFSEFIDEFENRKFTAGLLVAFIDFLIELEVPLSSEIVCYNDMIKEFPVQTSTNRGKPANTLIVQKKDTSTLSLRKFYDRIEQHFRADCKRFDYPSCAPHATQAWSSYPSWLDALVSYDEETLQTLRKQIIQHVMEKLPDQAFIPGSIKTEPPLFRLLLENFPMAAQKGEPSGAVFQGVVFGFLRADNPHLQMEISKVRTGSKRLQRVGDVDGWDGARLAISAEVKHFSVTGNDVENLRAFANETAQRGALGIVVANDFTESAKKMLEEIGLKALDTDDKLRIVELWDPLKQRTAVASLIYYSRHVEKNSFLSERIEAFVREASEYPLSVSPP